MAVGLKARANKYNAERVKIDGITFDSKLEAMRYQELKFLERANEIKQLDVHPTYPIVINDRKLGFIELDFEYYDIRAGFRVYEDVKGHDTALSRFKRAVLEATHNLTVRVVQKHEIRGR